MPGLSSRRNEEWDFGKGCLIFIALGMVLVVGGFWAVRRVYLSDKPAPIREASPIGETTGAVTPGESSVGAPNERCAEVREDLQTMKRAGRAHEQTETILTAADINSLIGVTDGEITDGKGILHASGNKLR